MTIYDAGPLAAGPLCGLLKMQDKYRNSRDFGSKSCNDSRKIV